jgi:endonuclease/exonuclease/phosphatase family metal-dependent hydrolase
MIDHAICFFLIIGLGVNMFGNCKKSDVVAQGYSEEANAIPEYSLLLKQERRQGYYNKPLTVMTRNVYVGSDVDRVLACTDLEEIPSLVKDAFNMLNTTNFHERAQSFAREIYITKPLLIGLQEISLVRVQSKGDFFAGNPVGAEEKYIDFLQVLLDALHERDLNYKVAGKIKNSDIELPMVPGMNDELVSDVRLTDYDVVIVQNDVEILNVDTANYQVRLQVDGIGTIPRGFIAVDVLWNSRKYKFVNTHLEPAPASNPHLLSIQRAQAQEIIERFSNSDIPVIIVGDFNSPAPDADTYKDLLNASYIDVWTQNLFKHNPAGNTYGHDLNLLNPGTNFFKRIDFIFVKNSPNEESIGPVFAIVVGDEDRNRTESGLWPSDHGGVVARLRLD